MGKIVKIMCQACNGTGKREGRICARCKGRGQDVYEESSRRRWRAGAVTVGLVGLLVIALAPDHAMAATTGVASVSAFLWAALH